MGLKLNLSDQEANSKARSTFVPPTGEYLCNIVEVQEKEVKPGAKNAGKPFWNIRFVVDQGDNKYDGSSIFSNVMLFEGALYSIKQLVESVFPELVNGQELTVPDPEAFEGKQVVVVGIKRAAGSKDKKSQRVIEQDTFDVRGFKPSTAKPKTTEKSELLP